MKNIDLRKIEFGFNHLRIGHTRLCYKANVVEGFQSRYLLYRGLFKEAENMSLKLTYILFYENHKHWLN